MEVEFDEGAAADAVTETPQEAPEQPVAEAEAPEPTPEPEAPAPITFTDEQQQFINDNIVAKQVAKRGQAEREAEELRQRLQQIEAANQQPTDDAEPQLPTDVWADDYDKRVESFKRDHADWAKREAQREWDAQYAQQLEQQEQQKEQQAFMERVQTYTTRAEKLGITADALQVAGNAVQQMGIQDSVANYLLNDEHGPAVTMYLAKNLQEVQTIQQMDPIAAGIHIATEIKPKVTRKLKRDTPPEPTETVSGASVPEKERGPQGAVYE